MPQTNRNFIGVNLKKDVIAQIRDYVQEHPKNYVKNPSGYKSIAEFLTEAAYLHLQRLNEAEVK